MLGQYNIGALAVVQHVEEQHHINKRLKAIDERLMVEKQLTFRDEEVWCVVEDTGERFGAERFVCVYEFRDSRGKPVPHLTDAIVDEMQRRAKDGTGNILEARKIVNRRNAEREQRHREEADGTYRAIAKDFEDHRVMGNFQIIPRSTTLARTRARVRSQNVEQRLALEQARRIAAQFARG